MKPIATDTYNFKGLITRGYTYVDKTEVLYPLINDSIGSQFFLSRPRRFGKSLLISTIPSIVFTRLCEALAAKSPHKQFVMLVDEYDKPLLGTLNTPEVIKFRDALKSFYSVIKTKESLMRFPKSVRLSKRLWMRWREKVREKVRGRR